MISDVIKLGKGVETVQYLEELRSCANSKCDKKVFYIARMVGTAWTPDEENKCCCSEKCHERHDEDLRKLTAVLKTSHDD